MIGFYDYDIVDARINGGANRKRLIDYYHYLLNDDTILVATQLPNYHYVIGEWKVPERTSLWEYKE